MPLVRALVTLLSYAAAAFIICLTFPLTIVVRLVTWPFDRHRMAVSRSLRFLGEVLIRVYPFWRVTVEGALPPPPGTFVLVPNHQSMVDALAVACLPREMKWIGKVEAFRIPWLGWALRMAGYVPVLRGDKESGRGALGRLRGYLAAGIPVGLFAEGTRSRDGAVRPFRPGPFKLAIEAGVPVVPVAISGAGAALPADQPWVHPSEIRVRILAPIPTAGLTVDDVDRVREETRRRIAEVVEGPPSARATPAPGSR